MSWKLKRGIRGAGETWKITKGETKCKRIKEDMHRGGNARALHLTFTRGCLTFNPRTRFLYYTHIVGPAGHI